MKAEPSPSQHLQAACGTDVAYAVAGRGPGMVLCNGLTTSTHFWRYLEPHWASSRQVLSWDLPGHGESGPAASERSATLVGQPAIIDQLMDAAEMASAVQVGWSTGSQVVLEMYRQHPERCQALVLLIGSAGRVLSTAELPLPSPVLDWLARSVPENVFGATARVLARGVNTHRGRRVARHLSLIGEGTDDADAIGITSHLPQVHTPTLQRMLASAQDHNAWDLLPHIEVPVLIVAGDRDPFAPSETVGVRMHQQCPGSELLRLPHGTHTALLDHHLEIREAVDDFLQRRLD